MTNKDLLNDLYDYVRGFDGGHDQLDVNTDMLWRNAFTIEDGERECRIGFKVNREYAIETHADWHDLNNPVFFGDGPKTVQFAIENIGIAMLEWAMNAFEDSSGNWADGIIQSADTWRQDMLDQVTVSITGEDVMVSVAVEKDWSDKDGISAAEVQAKVISKS